MTPAHPVCCWLRKISREITFENAPRREVSHTVVTRRQAERKKACPTRVNKL
jgi:hypothetical protein